MHLFGTACANTDKVPLNVMPMGEYEPEIVREMYELTEPLIEMGKGKPHVLAVFVIGNWNDDLSPWQSPALGRKQEDFGGKAGETLGWILNRFMPAAEAQFPAVRGGARGLLGYSLAGLFALWAMLHTDGFQVFGSCSGSLWYEGFAGYFADHAPMTPCSAYISLGDREEAVRHPVFARVGDATRQIAAYLETSPGVRDSVLEWNSGGHADAVGERLAKAQIWMCKRM